MSYADDFLRAMADAGLAMHKPEPIVPDGRLHRFRVDGDKPSSRNGWFVFYDGQHPHGAFGSWKTGQGCTWHAAKPESLSPAERQAMIERQKAIRAARLAEQSRVRAEAAAKAERLWSRAKPASILHPYLQRKQTRSFGVRELCGQLVIPMRDGDGQLQSLQFISPDGQKTFLTGGRKRGCYYAIGRPVNLICLAEGFATAASIHEATGYATAVAFDAGNLKPVALTMREKFPALPLLICADNDASTPGNPGLSAARDAALAVGAAVVYPVFPEVRHG